MRHSSRGGAGAAVALEGAARRCIAARAARDGEPDYRVRKILPIFPLGVVALPAAVVPLMIFEARYRVLFNTLLAGMPDIEEGLVQEDSDWCGTKRFGMCYVDQEGRMAAIGTTLEITDFDNVPDGRLLVNNKGCEKFKVLRVVKEKPVLVCEVETVPEEDEHADGIASLAKEVAQLLRDTIKLNVKMQSLDVEEERLSPKELDSLGPKELSYWVASFFQDVKLLQQNLLEEDSTLKRLKKEKDILAETVKYYSAAAALKGAFSSDTEGGGGGTGGGDDPTKKKNSGKDAASDA